MLTLGVLDNGLTQMRVDSYLREVLVGAIILAAVGAVGHGTARDLRAGLTAQLQADDEAPQTRRAPQP